MSRERADGLFRPFTYLCQKLVGEVIVTLFVSLACSALVFYTVRLAGNFAYFWLDYFMTTLCGIGEGPASASDGSLPSAASTRPGSVFRRTQPTVHAFGVVVSRDGTTSPLGLGGVRCDLCAAAVGYAVASWSPNMEVANVALPLYVTVLLFFVRPPP